MVFIPKLEDEQVRRNQDDFSWAVDSPMKFHAFNGVGKTPVGWVKRFPNKSELLVLSIARFKW